MNKYERQVTTKLAYDFKAGATVHITIDVYDVLTAFGITCPAQAHAIKKMLMPGERGHKSRVQDLEEAIVAIQRAIELAPANQPAEGGHEAD